jgi:hypothetical protein
MLAHTFTDEPIVLGSDDGPGDGDDDLDNTHAPIALDGEQLGHDALDLDILPSPFSRSVDKVEDGDRSVWVARGCPCDPGTRAHSAGCRRS